MFTKIILSVNKLDFSFFLKKYIFLILLGIVSVVSIVINIRPNINDNGIPNYGEDIIRETDTILKEIERFR